MAEVKRLNLILGVMAVMILVSSCAAFAYSLAPRGDTTKVIVNDVEYTRNDVFTYFGDITFEVDGDLFEGVRLSDIIIDSGLPNAVSHDYRIIGSDTYQKDVRWDDMVNGYLVEDEFKTVFPELTKSFWVSDVVYIEVI